VSATGFLTGRFWNGRWPHDGDPMSAGDLKQLLEAAEGAAGEWR